MNITPKENYSTYMVPLKLLEHLQLIEEGSTIRHNNSTPKSFGKKPISINFLKMMKFILRRPSELILALET